MATGFFDISIRDPSGKFELITVNPRTTVGEIRTLFTQRVKVPSDRYRLIFAGRSLCNDDTLAALGVQGHSTLHMIHGQNYHDQTINISKAETHLGEVYHRQDVASDTSHRFFVYCKVPCKSVQPGKLRVRCSDCKDQAFELFTDPQCWDDVLNRKTLRGKCNNIGCFGCFAEFFFKCAAHAGAPGDNEECVALHMIRVNTVNLECPICFDIKERVVVFECAQQHTVCYDCFFQLCRTALAERHFVEHREYGYTIKCPSNCDDSYISESHHFRILGEADYEKYQRFGTEEYILQMGGILCPGTNCGMGILPESVGRRIKCPECKFVFCRHCKLTYHEGYCTEQAPIIQENSDQVIRVDPVRLEQSRWNAASTMFILENNAIKPCPQCKRKILKDGGCMHMTCSHCHYEWCWICSVKWSNTCRDSHWFGERN